MPVPLARLDAAGEGNNNAFLPPVGPESQSLPQALTKPVRIDCRFPGILDLISCLVQGPCKSSVV
jgi:hypothetical protein